jgi:hypothetical protein
MYARPCPPVQVEAELSVPARAHIGRNLARRYWHQADPTLISECVFATANIFSSLKLVHIFTVNPHLGPLQISLGRMVIDILKFGFVYLLVLFAFACGLNQLFWFNRQCEHAPRLLVLVSLTIPWAFLFDQTSDRAPSGTMQQCANKSANGRNSSIVPIRPSNSRPIWPTAVHRALPALPSACVGTYS